MSSITNGLWSSASSVWQHPFLYGTCHLKPGGSRLHGHSMAACRLVNVSMEHLVQTYHLPRIPYKSISSVTSWWSVSALASICHNEFAHMFRSKPCILRFVWHIAINHTLVNNFEDHYYSRMFVSENRVWTYPWLPLSESEYEPLRA